MELAFMAIYITFSLLLYVVIDFKLKKCEALNQHECNDKFKQVESGIRRLEDDYVRVLNRLEMSISEIKDKLQ